MASEFTVGGRAPTPEEQDIILTALGIDPMQLEGDPGPPGPAGPAGSSGPAGAAGAAGPTGATGAIGPQGPAGTPGGPPGPAGPAGPQGPVGPTGATGATGSAGATGPQGLQGATGLTGATGPAGTTGATGAAGATGPAGPTGAMGPAGPAGPAGPMGATGSAGATGPAGPAGPTGAAGPAGADGATGPAGAMGPAGATGPAGPQGIQGIQGPSGSGLTYFGGGMQTLLTPTGAGDGGGFASKGSIWTPDVNVSVTKMACAFTPLATTDSYRFGIAAIDQSTSAITSILFQTATVVQNTTARVLKTFDINPAIQLTSGTKYLFYVSFTNAATGLTAVRVVAAVSPGVGPNLSGPGPIAYNSNAQYNSVDLVAGNVFSSAGTAGGFVIGPVRGHFLIDDYEALF